VATDSTTYVVPSQTSNSGKYLTTNGTTSSWASISGSTADPTEPSSPSDGQIWVDTDGTAPTTVVTRWSKTPTNGTTTLSGTDDTTNTLAYSPGFEQVFLNGVLLSRTSDYTATTGTSVVLVTATVTNDIVEIICALQVAYTDVITTAAAATTFVAKALTTTTGDIIYASAANTPARLGIGSSAQVLTVASGVPSWATPASGASFYGCSVYKSAAQTIATSTSATLTFNTEALDIGGYHDTVTNNSRITIPSGKAGYYMIQCKVGFVNNATGQRSAFLLLNGGATAITRFDQSIASNNENQHVAISQLYNCIVGDYFEVAVYQTSGGNLNVNSGANETTFSVTYLGA
jgi:hypothetical protein